MKSMTGAAAGCREGIPPVNEIAIIDNTRKDRYDVQVIKHLYIFFSGGLLS